MEITWYTSFNLFQQEKSLEFPERLEPISNLEDEISHKLHPMIGNPINKTQRHGWIFMGLRNYCADIKAWSSIRRNFFICYFIYSIK